MTDSFLRRVFGTVVATVLAVTAAVDDASLSADEAKEPVKREARSSLAEKAEASAGKGDRSPADGQADPLGGRGPIGRDVGWPNCPTGMGIPARRTLGLPMPPAGSNYVIIGLTNGPAFYPNPCLKEQVEHARQLQLWTAAYAVVTYPTPSQLRTYGDAGPHPRASSQGELSNTGWAQAQMNLSNMRAAGLEPPIVWVDVEPVLPPAPWSDDVDANRAVLEGAMRAYRAAGLQVGVYSTAYLWQSIVGPVSYGLPEWRAGGPTSKARALSLCTSGAIQGGDAVLAQWSSVDVDYNVLCPGRSTDDVLSEYFTLE